jgi:hypothetical protein
MLIAVSAAATGAGTPNPDSSGVQPDDVLVGAPIGTRPWFGEEGPLDWVLGHLPVQVARDSAADPALSESLFEQVACLAQTECPQPMGISMGSLRDIDGEIRRRPEEFIDAFSARLNNSAPFVLFDWSRSSVDAPPISPFRLEGQQRVAVTKTGVVGGDLSSKIALREPDDPLDPGRRRTWDADESLRMAVAGPLFVFGQFGASTPWVDQQTSPKWQGKYGVGVKLKPWLVDEVQVRGGPAVKSDDSGRWVRGPSGERSEMFIEAVTKLGVPVVGPINLEYTSTAVPPAAVGERSLFNQDFKIARPLPGGGQVHIGAKLRADDVPATATWVDRMQVYLGFELKR